ncbi:MAG: rRNA pseudouridine synthase [Tissierellia bacterium]|nr:rRNA pseudouridine synthase [Tissierellia bacterium]
MRLQKYLAHCGVASRRKAEELIINGDVKVNNEIIIDPAFDVGENDIVKYKNKRVYLSKKNKYFMLNKPIGVVSTASDEKGRANVVDLIDTDSRVYPVGRLDIDTSGIILLTNDGELTNIMTHPKYGVMKKYIATVEGTPNAKALYRLRNGVRIENYVTGKAKVKILKSYPTDSVVEIVINEGKNRQVRKMFDTVGHRVKSLKRIEIGEIMIGGLNQGEYRELDSTEMEYIQRLKNAKI